MSLSYEVWLEKTQVRYPAQDEAWHLEEAWGRSERPYRAGSFVGQYFEVHWRVMNLHSLLFSVISTAAKVGTAEVKTEEAI